MYSLAYLIFKNVAASENLHICSIYIKHISRKLAANISIPSMQYDFKLRFN